MTEPALDTLLLPPDYVPSEDEEYMNPMMLAYFKQRLYDWKNELLRESSDTLNALQEGGLQEPDIIDRASIEADKSLEFRTRDRERKLISKIDAAIQRIEKGEDYGYCMQTGEPIGVERMLARPTATLSVEAQKAHEQNEKIYK